MKFKFLPLLFLSFPIFAQTATSPIIIGDQLNLNYERNKMAYTTSFDNRYEGLKGTYYLIPEWLEGDIFGTGGTKIASRVPIKYDAYNKQLVRKRSEKDSVAVSASAFTLYDKENSYHFIQVPQFVTTKGKKISATYLQVLYKDKITFVKDFTKTLSPANYKGAYAADKTFDSFDNSTDYFVIKTDGGIEEIKLSKKGFLKVFEDRKDDLEKYFQANTLDPKNEADALKIIMYYNSLLANSK
jgi:hypothetical protein